MLRSTFVYSFICSFAYLLIHSDSIHKAPIPCRIPCWVLRLETKRTHSLIKAHIYYFLSLLVDIGAQEKGALIPHEDIGGSVHPQARKQVVREGRYGGGRQKRQPE